MSASYLSVSRPLAFPSQLSSPIKQRKPRRLPPGVASFAEHASRRRSQGADLPAAAELAAQRHLMSSEDKRLLKTLIRAYQEQIAELTCQLIRAGEANHD